MTARKGVSSATLTTLNGSLGSLVKVILNVTLLPEAAFSAEASLLSGIEVS